MAVRNFWVEADVDGRRTNVAGGPAAKNGGMDVTLYVRDQGAIHTAVQLYCRAFYDELIIDVNVEGKSIQTIKTRR